MRKEIYKEMPSIQKEIESNLNPFDILEIDKVEDHIVPIEVAAKMKDVSITSIEDAIKRGVLKRVNGITLKSLMEYKVDSKKRTSGKIRAMKKLEKKIMKLEKELKQEEKEKVNE